MRERQSFSLTSIPSQTTKHFDFLQFTLIQFTMSSFGYRGPQAGISRPSGIPKPGTGISRPSMAPSSVNRQSYGASSQPSATRRLFGAGAPGTGRPSVGFGTVNRNNTSASGFSAAKSAYGGFSARKSMKGPTGGLFSQTPQNKNRLSFSSTISQSTGRRRSSIGNAAERLQDTRPLSDSQYHKAVVAKLNDILEQNGMNPMQRTFASSPTAKDVHYIFDTLFKLMGIFIMQKETLGPLADKSWQDKVLYFSDQLGYPFQLKKIATVYVSATDKGQLFGLLEWLCESAMYFTKVNPEVMMNPTIMEDMNGAQDMNLGLEFLNIALEAKDDESCVANALRNLAKKKYGSKEEIKRLEDNVQELLEDNEKRDQDIEEIKCLPKALESIQKELNSWDKWSSDMTERVNMIKNELDNAQQDKELKEKGLKELEKRRKELQKQIQSQEFDIENLEWAKDRQDAIELEIKRENEEIEDLKKKIRQAKHEVNKYHDLLFKQQASVSRDLESVIETLKMPLTAPYVKELIELLESKKSRLLIQNLNCKIDLENEKPGTGDIRNDVQTLISELNIKIQKQEKVLEGSVMIQDEQKFQKMDQEISEKEKRIQVINNLIEKLKQDMDDERKDENRKHAAIVAEYESNRQYLSELDSKMKQSQEELTERIRKLDKQAKSEEKDLLECKQKQVDMFKGWADQQRADAKAILDCYESANDHLRAQVKGLKEVNERGEKKVARFHDKVELYQKTQAEKAEKKALREQQKKADKENNK